MKRILMFFLSAILILNLSACGEPVSGESGKEKNTVITLTNENWMEYLEFRTECSALTNAFDEVNGALISYKLCFKESVSDRITAIEELSLEYALTNPYACQYEYNSTSQILIKKDAVPEETSYETTQFGGTIKLYLLDAAEGVSLTPSCHNTSMSVSGDTVYFTSVAFDTMEITRIQGTLTLS